jgi:hypothetical protein
LDLKRIMIVSSYPLHELPARKSIGTVAGCAVPVEDGNGWREFGG